MNGAGNAGFRARCAKEQHRGIMIETMIDAYTIVENLKASGFDERKTKNFSAAIQNLKSDIVTREYPQAHTEAVMKKHLVKESAGTDFDRKRDHRSD